MQIARGMSYLEECGLVHRDLAARNILVFSKDIVKISDFGMSRALQLGKSYYQSNLNVNLKLPIAWCAPECIHDSLFTIHSDMWAYGITLWEIFTYGFTPWAGLTGRQVLEMIDSPRFGRLDQPDSCPDPIYDAVMRACWAHEPKARPTFAQLLGMLPRLSPEIWITTNEYHPDTDSNLDSISTTEEFPYNPGFRPHGTRSLSRPLFIRANETVCVLGKSAWKVVNLRTGLVGCIPSGILKPYVIPGNDSSSLRDHHTLTKNSNVNNNTGSISNSMGLVAKTRLRISRRASLTDLALRKTVCRLSKLSLINPTEHSNNNSSSGGTTSRSRTKLTADQISLPQNDFRHIGHVGSDGRTFGELGMVGKIVIDSKDNFSDSQSLHDFHVSEETCKFTKANNMNNKSNTLQINPSSVKTYQAKLVDMSKNVDLFSTKISSKVNGSTKASIDKLTTTSFNKNYNGSDNGGTDLFDDIKFNVISESNGFDLGSSLLDEVFKCFPMDNSTAEKRNHNIEDINEPDTTATTSDNKVIGKILLKSTDCLNNQSITNSPALSLTSDLTERDRQLSESNGFRLSYSTNKMNLLDTSTRINTNDNCNSKNNKQNNHVNALNSFALSYQTQRTLNCEHINDVSIDSTYTDENTIIDDTIDVDNKHKNIKSDIKTESKFSWKRNSFGSLTRRSSSISKTSNKVNLITGFNQSDDNKRLTISRPVLLSRPNSITQTSLNRLPSNSSSSASIIGTLTEPSSLGSSTTSRDSSLTIVSSSNGCNSSSGVGGGYASSLSNGHDEISVQELQQQNPHQSTLSSCKYELSTNASLSPAPSLSSMISATSSLPSHSLTSNITNNSTSLHCNSASTAQGCLRALRSGETVFRASMNTSTGNALNARRKFSTSSRTNLMLSADERPTNSRIPNLSPSVTLISLSTKNSTNDTTATATTTISSSSLLRSKSKLLFNRDIYQTSSSTERSPNRPAVTGTVTGGHTLQKYKDLNRTHLSHSSSSSSSISPLSTPFLGGESTVQCSNTNHTQSKLNHPMVTPTTKTLTGSNDNNISNIDLDCVVSSFLGKDFASFLDSSANNNNNNHNDDDHSQLFKTRVPLNFQSNLSKSPFKSSLSRLPSQLGKLRSTDNNEDDDVLAI
ncbi:Activated Cdc42 kinase-like [Schistosoma japonicum]|nr:Activated Cdc42 kinase-like [Schistosoma japonicum]